MTQHEMLVWDSNSTMQAFTINQGMSPEREWAEDGLQQKSISSQPWLILSQWPTQIDPWIDQLLLSCFAHFSWSFICYRVYRVYSQMCTVKQGWPGTSFPISTFVYGRHFFNFLIKEASTQSLDKPTVSISPIRVN